jgi:tRNA G18 (ribose-2'-O)-methylase SpoU
MFIKSTLFKNKNLIFKRTFSTGDQTKNQFKKALKKSKPDYLYGINSVLAALTSNRRDFLRLYLNISEKGQSPKSHDKIDQIHKMANHYGVKTKYMTKAKLSDFTGSRPHQNVVLKSSRIDYLNVRNMDEVYTSLEIDPKKQGQFFLMLDGITDP